MSRYKSCILACLVASLGGCASALPPSAFDGGQPEMRPETFFGQN